VNTKAPIKKISLCPDQQLHAAIEAERRAIAQRSGLRPSLSEVACSLIYRALASDQANIQA
jgi:hypothetical protein